jgi:cell division ATPase FtsA
VGYESTKITIVFDAQVVHHATTVIPLGGKDLDMYIHQQLKVPVADAIKIKELYAFCALSNKGAQGHTCADYALPDGTFLLESC